LDEPISQLDIHHQVELMDTLRHMVDISGTTVVAVLHDLNIASQYSDYIMLVNSGKIVEHGKPEDVLCSEVILSVYNLNVLVLQNPETGRPLIIPSRDMNRKNMAI